MTWENNFPVYMSNLSMVYVLSVLVSIVAVVFTMMYPSFLHRGQSSKSSTNKGRHRDANAEDNPSPNLAAGEFGGALGKIKEAKNQIIEKSIRGDEDEETEEQKELEKQFEDQQIEYIWSLLEQQKEKFKLTTKEQMQAQLKLYR